jgi:hypothetical protein
MAVRALQVRLELGGGLVDDERRLAPAEAPAFCQWASVDRVEAMAPSDLLCFHGS